MLINVNTIKRCACETLNQVVVVVVCLNQVQCSITMNVNVL